MSKDWENNEEIKYFREYLRIPSVHPQPDYSKWKIFDIYLKKKYLMKYLLPKFIHKSDILI